MYRSLYLTEKSDGPVKEDRASYSWQYRGEQYFCFNFTQVTLAFDGLNVYAYRPQAWEDTHAKWEQATKQILNHPKNKVEDGQVSDFAFLFPHDCFFFFLL